MLYFAYGSNLHKGQMASRCPGAEPLGKLIMPNTRLVFRGVADVVADEGVDCPGGIWRITARCEAALDRYEGFRPDNPEGGMYSKEYVQMDGLPDGETEIMLYTMNSTGVYPPSDYYYNTLKEGYRDFGLKLAALRAALEHSHDEKHPSHVERKRTRRMGRPALAPRPAVKSKPVQSNKPHGMLQEPPKAKLTYHDPWAADVSADQRRCKVMNLDDWLKNRRSGGDRY